MGDIEQNLSVWTERWDWSDQGDDWSSWWGGTDAMWHAALLPRIQAFVPTGTILEIAPGYGRWTQYLKDVCDRLVLVDLADNCIDHCRQRFSSSSHLEYHVNDGRSLAMVADDSVDFVFSFDSLVHADQDVLDAYISQLRTKLTRHGVAFLHHSNAGAYRASAALAKRVPRRWVVPLVRRGVLLDLMAWRSPVAADHVARQADAAGLACVSQERITWESGYYLIDTITVLTQKGSRWDRPRATFSNRFFGAEARRTARLYARSSFPGSSPP
jgi:hypothetical protein